MAVSLVIASILVYTLHYGIFRDAHHILLYLIGDIAFVPIEVLLVTLIIHKLLNAREKRMRLQKLNMVVGVFFSEVGMHLLTYFSDIDPQLEDIRKELIVTNDWDGEEFARVNARLTTHDYSVHPGKVDLQELKEFLVGKRGFLLRLLENPNLLEHESFTDLLQAVFHLTEELDARQKLDLSDKDLEHIVGDIARAYTFLVREWLSYMQHLKNNYPYLFSLAMRTNPFDETATPVVS